MTPPAPDRERLPAVSARDVRVAAAAGGAASAGDVARDQRARPALRESRPAGVEDAVEARVADARRGVGVARRQRRVRLGVTAGVLVAVIVALGVVSLATGTLSIPPADLLAAVTGHGDRRTMLVLSEFRLPRLGLALVVGAALGAAGALFQSITRNPLGSPDVVGFTSGAATGALAAILLLPDGTVSGGVGALAGGLVVAILSVMLGGTGPRLILVGIGLAALLTSVNAYLLTRADVTDAQNAAVWLVGSLNGRGSHLWSTAIALAILLPAAALCTRGLQILELGDDKAVSLGVGLDRRRTTAIGIGVLLTAAGVAAAGPIAFIALAAPQLARRVTRVAAPLVVTSALFGAALLLAADFTAQRLLAPQQIPVGAMTGSLGGLYLAALLARRRRTARS